MPLELRGPTEGFAHILTAEACAFVEMLARIASDRVDICLAAREKAQQAYDAGNLPDFPIETTTIRSSDWKVAPLPDDLRDRRVEITGPVDRKMVINALNSGANTFMADFEDSCSPTWHNILAGQENLRDAVRGTISFEHPTKGTYRLVDDPAVLLVRPRGWHLKELHCWVDGRPVPAGVFDFGLYFFHNAEALLSRGSGPYFYLPKLQHYLEARLWNTLFVAAQDALGIPQGTIKATVLIETLPAAFQMDEILWELRAHSAGLNCGRWDYIFSFIKCIRNHANLVLPDRSDIGMTQHCMKSYTQRVIQVCHRRGVHAMGGMAAQIPIRRDPDANARALDKVRADKLREVTDGHDGTWVAHPGLIATAREVFDAHMPGANQIANRREEVAVTREDLLALPTGRRTEEGLRWNVRVGVLYLEAWLRGNGCVPLFDLMEDAATAEISRTQLWQWVRHEALLEDGTPVTAERVRNVLAEELTALLRDAPEDHAFPEAARIFDLVSTSETFIEFLTLPAYEQLLTREAS